MNYRRCRCCNRIATREPEGTQLQEAYENAGYAGDDTVAHHLTAISVDGQVGVCLPATGKTRWTSTYRRSDWF
jgi:hypothetical protein